MNCAVEALSQKVGASQEEIDRLRRNLERDRITQA